MAVFDRSDLKASSLADLHAVASQIGLDGFRRLRKEELIDLILTRSGSDDGGSSEDAATPASEDDGASKRPRRARTQASAASERAKRSETEGDRPSERSKRGDAEEDTDARRTKRSVIEDGGAEQRASRGDADEEESSVRRRRGRRRRTKGAEEEDASARPGAASDGQARRDRARSSDDGDDGGDGGAPGGRGDARTDADEDAQSGTELVEGVVEVVSNGSGFLRPKLNSDLPQFYLTAGQVRRCELVSGDTITGRVRPARHPERQRSIARVETINGEPASAIVLSGDYENLKASFPATPLALHSEDVTVAAIARFAPLGKGSRAVITGAPFAGKTETLRKLVAALADNEDLAVEVLLLGVRPEEVDDWQDSSPTTTLTLSAGSDIQARALERAIGAAKRKAAKGTDVLLVIDTLEGVSEGVARKALAAARNLKDHGSLTVIATAPQPFGGETTVIALDSDRATTGQLPAIEVSRTITLRADLLVGEQAAAEIAKQRASTLAL